MLYRSRYLKDVEESVRILSPETKTIIRACLDALRENPGIGTPLSNELTGWWRFRAKRYRIIYKVDDKIKEVSVLIIDKRETVYQRVYQMIMNKKK